MGAAGGGGVFISYRREETSHFAGRLAYLLTDRFGAEQVFIDVETIEPGTDFAEAISRAVDTCAVLVAVIGPGWLAAADQRGGQRLDDPDDLVRLEIGTALARGVRVIPVLVEGAVMPGREDLPDSLAGLARRHALRIRHESFRDDAERLVAAIERVSAEVKEGSGTGRNDPARVARLLGDAERIASSLTDRSAKASALRDVAAAMAATDPDRAERIANSLTGKSAKAMALIGVARALAA
jgi:hypothetical protein